MFKYCIALLISLQVFPALGQDAKEDILKINSSLMNLRDLSMNITYNVYSDYHSTNPVETSLGSYVQSGTFRYNKLSDIESIQNKDYLIVIDNSEKKIMVGNPSEFNQAKITMVHLDTAFSKYSSVKLIANGPSRREYQITFKSSVASEYERMDLSFNPRTYLTEKITFYYRTETQLATADESAAKTKPRLEIIFSKVNTKSRQDQNFFSESRFIEKRNGKYYPAIAYNGYAVINQRFIK